MNKNLYLALSLSIASTGVLNIVLYKTMFWTEFCLANLLAFAYHFVGHWIKIKSVGSEVGDFLKFSLGLNFLKNFVFFFLIIGIMTLATIFMSSFFITLFVSYIVFLTSNVLNWHFGALDKHKGVSFGR